eukprot:2188183-Pyramimonas_sp.AAC.1
MTGALPLTVHPTPTPNMAPGLLQLGGSQAPNEHVEYFRGVPKQPFSALSTLFLLIQVMLQPLACTYTRVPVSSPKARAC